MSKNELVQAAKAAADKRRKEGPKNGNYYGFIEDMRVLDARVRQIEAGGGFLTAEPCPTV
jgi:hypothetical protein